MKGRNVKEFRKRIWGKRDKKRNMIMIRNMQLRTKGNLSPSSGAIRVLRKLTIALSA